MTSLSQRDLAKRAGLSCAYVSQLERGCHEPSISVLHKLADHLGIRRDELILHAAGLPMTDVAVSAEFAIQTDTRLSTAQREALLGVLHSYVESNASECMSGSKVG
jgi:transcriptional regulator with XRE-family HTH domain